MKRKILSVLIICLVTVAMAQQGVKYRITSDGTLEVAGYTGSKEYLLIVPEKVELDGRSYTVTAIADSAFYGNGSSNDTCRLVSIFMPNTIKRIGNMAFANCNMLSYIRMSPNVEHIGHGAFFGCNALGRIDLPESIVRIDSAAFASTQGMYTIGISQLPELTKIPEKAFQECRRLRHFPIGDKVTEIGESAFRNAGLVDINLSGYQGEIGKLAFNGCDSLSHLVLPTDNAYCYNSEDGKVLYERQQGCILSVLPSVESLVVGSPETGAEEILDGKFSRLTLLELPHTWKTAISAGMHTLRDLTVRTEKPFQMSLSTWAPELKVNVFNYAQKYFVNASSWNQFVYQDINRPTEQLYIAEVWPMYDGRKCRLGRDGVVWEPENWNQELEEKFPQYFSSESYNEEDKTDYREFQLSRYLTDEKVYTYGGQPYEIIHCIDGNIHLSSAFDVNDYVNWYLHTDTIFGNELYYKTDAVITHVKAGTQVDANGNVSDTDYWSIGCYNYNLINLDYALNMVPGIVYDVDLLVAPFHYGEKYYISIENDSIPIKERVEYSLLYNNQNEDGQMAQSALDTLIVEYNGKVQPIRLYENIEVKGDWGNKLRLKVLRVEGTYNTKNGYDKQLNIVGVVAKPKTDVPLLPTAVERPADSAPVPVAYYDLSGRRLSKPVRGVNIVRYSDGSSRRVMVR